MKVKTITPEICECGQHPFGMCLDVTDDIADEELEGLE